MTDEGKAVFSQPEPLMKLTHIMSNFFLNQIVSEAAKTFGKSHQESRLKFAFIGETANMYTLHVSKRVHYRIHLREAQVMSFPRIASRKTPGAIVA